MASGRIDKLFRDSAVQTVVLLHIFLIYIIYPMRETYAKRYGSPAFKAKSGEADETSVRAEVDFQAHSEDGVIQKSDADDWKWRTLPTIYPAIWWFRAISTGSMVFLLFKNLAPYLLGPLVPHMNLSKPLHCYLVGRFVIQYNVQHITSLAASAFHLCWRCLQVYHGNPTVASVLYFLMLDDEDVERYYRLLASDERFGCQISQSNDQAICLRNRNRDRSDKRSSAVHDPRVQFMHDVMSYQIAEGSEIKYELRPNRTRKAARILRRITKVFLLLDVVMLASSVLLLSGIVAYQVLDVRTYLRNYPNCSAEVEELRGTEKLDGWSLRMLTKHQYIALAADVQENFFLWFESSLVGVLDMSLITLLNYDLYLYWKSIDTNIDRLLVLISSDHEERSERLNSESRINTDYSDSMFQQDHQIAVDILKLQLQIQDLIAEIKKTDGIITDSYTCILAMWFFIFGYCIYKLHIVESSLPIYLVLMTVLTVVLFSGTVILIIQRLLRTSYSRICSLMAYDRSQHKQNFIQILDYFTKHRTCYTICRGYPMRSATLLSIISYSFSYFFIIGSTNYRL